MRGLTMTSPSSSLLSPNLLCPPSTARKSHPPPPLSIALLAALHCTYRCVCIGYCWNAGPALSRVQSCVCVGFFFSSNSRNSRLRLRCPAGLALLVLVHCSLAPTTLSSSSLSAGGGGDGGGLAAVAGGSSGGGGGGVDVSAPVLAAGLALAGAASLALGLDHHPLGPMTHVPNVTLLSSVVAPPVSAAAVSSGPWEVSGGCPEAVVRGGGGGGPAPALPSLGVVVGEAAPIATPSLSPASPTPAPSQSLSSQHTAERPSEGQPPRESPWQEVPAPAVAPSASTLHVVVTATGEVCARGCVVCICVRLCALHVRLCACVCVHVRERVSGTGECGEKGWGKLDAQAARQGTVVNLCCSFVALSSSSFHLAGV